jgi:hypothetical protein
MQRAQFVHIEVPIVAQISALHIVLAPDTLAAEGPAAALIEAVFPDTWAPWLITCAAPVSWMARRSGRSPGAAFGLPTEAIISAQH